MRSEDQVLQSELVRDIRLLLVGKLRKSRLAPVMLDVGKNSRPGFTDLGVVSGFLEPEFVQRFGASLDKVNDADIVALTLYLLPRESLGMALGQLAEHIQQAPEGTTGLPSFDEWQPRDDEPSSQIPVVWTYSYQERPRELLAQGFRIGKSRSSDDGVPEAYVTILVSRQVN